MPILLKRGLAALALAVCASTFAHAEPACVITPQGVAQIQLGDTFKDLKLKHPNGFGVYMDPETMSKFLMLFDGAKSRAAYQRDGSPDFDHVPFLIHFEDYDLSEKESDTDVRKLALPKDSQKITRIEVRRKTCLTPEGLHPGMLLKDSIQQHGGIKHIEGAEGLGDKAVFVHHPQHLAFDVDGAIVRRSPKQVTWTTRRYRPDATITSITILPR